MSNPIDLVKNYMNGTKAIPLPPNSQAEAELYNSENEKAIEGQTEAQTKLAIEINKDLENAERKRRYDAEKALYESNQQELDDLDNDLDQSEPDYDDDEFSGSYFEKPDDENEQKESLGDRIRAKYDSFSEKISNSAGSAAGSFVSGFNKKMDSFERGDPLFSTGTKRPAKGRNIRYVSRPTRQNKNLSRPYVGGRFDDSFTLGANGGNNLYYPVNETRKSSSLDEPRDLYLPSGANPYDGEFSGRNAFKQSEFSDERERYDPFGFGMGGRLSADGFNNMSGEFGDSLLGGVGNSKESSIFGGMNAGTDTVFGDGAMFNANRAKGKKESSGFGLDMIIGDSGGMFATTDPSPRKTTTQRKKATKAKPTKRKQTKRRASPRKQASSIAFALP